MKFKMHSMSYFYTIAAAAAGPFNRRDGITFQENSFPLSLTETEHLTNVQQIDRKDMISNVFVI